jgi:hypothetical protein
MLCYNMHEFKAVVSNYIYMGIICECYIFIMYLYLFVIYIGDIYL